MEGLFELSNRANIEVYHFGKKDIVLYDDHRTILDVLYYLKINNLIQEVPNVISFDYHDDAKPLSDELKSEINNLMANNPSLQEFWGFVDFSLSFKDDDWVSAGCEMGLIKDYVNIGACPSYNIDREQGLKLIDIENNEHHLFTISHLDESLGERGCLGDSCICYPYYQSVRNIFQYRTEGSRYFNEENIYPFILDFDLDCFTCNIEGFQKAWPKSIYREKYGKNWLVKDFLNELIDRSTLVTICRESGSCGGVSESQKILKYLSKDFFGNVFGL